MKEELNKLLTVQEVAERLRVSQRSVFRYLKAKKIRGIKLGGEKTSIWRIPEKEIERFLEYYLKE